MLVVLGIDPGTVKTGYGVLLAKGNQLECKSYGLITPPVKTPFPDRLKFIHEEIGRLHAVHKPHHTAVEKIFFGKNPQVAFKLGHIFASCLLQSQEHGSLFFEYASRFVKKNVTFSGGASKELVRRFMNNKFSIQSQKPFDSTDALAVAFCHIQTWRKNQTFRSAFSEVKL